MTSLLDRIAQFIARHQMFRPGDRAGVAVSGGADSVFLLHALRDLAPRWSLELSVVHIEHGIRGEASIADAEFVGKLAGGFGLPFHLHRADVPALMDNLEQAARGARLGFYRELLQSGRLDRIATGHTRSDQAETVLYRVLRGSGLAGLAGILPVAEPGLVRPLLELNRAEIQDWLCQRSIVWREDQTNQDCSYARNRLRHQVLPMLADSFNPRLEEALANLATLAKDEELYWDAEIDRLQPVIQEPLVIPVSILTSRPAAVARRLIRRLIQTLKGDLRQIDFPHVERILQMTQSSEGHDRVQIPGLDIFRSFEWLRFSKIAPNPVERDFSLPLLAPGFAELPGSSGRITLQVQEKPESAKPCATVVNELDFERLRAADGAAPTLELRNWRPGDKYRPAGRSQEEKIKLMFQEGRVPLWERRHWPIITYNGIILWTRRFGAAADFAASPGARVVLRIDESS
ncbi:MAG TPA: tRNA lysidine(34) synthetase TilS [Bryobacteraceae bacterium]|nr:tRNA lysidine(34) synthetase TilS [Bryobacteraceae bacterium]